MTTFQPQQSDPGRRVHRKAGANALQIHFTNCTTKLHGRFHEARKNVCSKFQGAVQEHVNEWSFYTREALPLSWLRILRLAQISPLDARSPARRPRDGRETSGKTSGGISRLKSAPCPGNGQTVATAMPPNVCQDGSQGSLVAPHTNARCPRRKLAGQLATQSRNSYATVKATSRKMTRSNLNHDVQKL